MADIKLGDRIKARINYGMEGGGLLPKEEGIVVYVHPKGRFFTLEFTFPGPEGPQRFRESYIMDPAPSTLAPELTYPTAWRRKSSGALGKYLESL